MADEIRKDESRAPLPSSPRGMDKDAEREAIPQSDEKTEEKQSWGMKLKAMWKKAGLEPAVLLTMAKYASFRLQQGLR